MQRILMTSVTLAACLIAGARALASGPNADLQLKSCTVELIDGRKVEGQLAVQFEMDDHLIVYSPRLATVRSFLKKHVHAYTVDGDRHELNPKRALSEEDERLLGRVDWPNAQPKEGLKPPYTTEHWDKPRQLMVWANPGRSGQLEKPGNWLMNGRQMTEWPRPTGEHYGFIFFQKGNVDFLFPAAGRDYTVRPRG
ncbi:MAG: hypothetical protein GVY16_01565, partial [Planctomycetes bacterium]|nr:hypothetical protein [Planctomycetota bacterium]